MPFALQLISKFRLVDPTGQELSIASAKLKLLIAAVAFADGRPVSRSELTGLLWGSREEGHARNSLRQALTALRKIIGDYNEAPFILEDEWISLSPAHLQTDVASLLKPDLPSSEIEEIPMGEFLEGIAINDQVIEEWLRQRRMQVSEAIQEKLISRSKKFIEDQDSTSALATLNRILAIDRTNEWAYRETMRCLAGRGDRAAALNQYRVCKQALADELDIEPERKTTELFEALSEDRPLDRSNDSQIPPNARAPDDKPSVAVLPFKVLSPGENAAFLADALSQSITLALARFRDLTVIASHSTQVYKETSATIRQIGEELGVRYLVEGSVQSQGDRVRITALLVDTNTQGHLWLETWDDQLDDVFGTQDRITERTVGSIANSYGGRIRKAWQRANREARPAKFSAFDYFMRGLAHGETYNFKSKEPAVLNFEKAIEIDPNYAKPKAKLAWVHLLQAVEGWGDDYDADFNLGVKIAKEAMQTDPLEPWCHWVNGACQIYKGDLERGIAFLERAHELNPNDADILCDLGYYNSYLGNNQTAIDLMLRAIRINPHHPVWYLLELVQVYFDAKRYEDAIATFAEIEDLDACLSALYCAASHAALGQTKEAERVVELAISIDPEATVAKYAGPKYSPYQKSEAIEHFAKNLKKAGLPID